MTPKLSASADVQAGDDSPSAQQCKSSPESERCIQYFDALWFCYSPVHQMSEYYRHGLLDSCQGHWQDWWGCVARKTRLGSPAPPRVETCIWNLRTPEEAAQFWKQEFRDESHD